jgi:hypothetical protein
MRGIVAEQVLFGITLGCEIVEDVDKMCLVSKKVIFDRTPVIQIIQWYGDCRRADVIRYPEIFVLC